MKGKPADAGPLERPVRPGAEAPECPACHGSGVIQTHDSGGLADQFACDLCSRDDASEREAFEAWMKKRGTPLHLEQTQAFDAFKAGMVHQACMTAVLMWQAESKADKSARMKLADNDVDGARQFRAVASHLKAMSEEWYGPKA